MAHDSSRRTLTQLHAVTGAPALVLLWALALTVGLPLADGSSVAPNWLRDGAPLTVWWSLVALCLSSHLVARALLARHRAAGLPGTETGTQEEGAASTSDERGAVDTRGAARGDGDDDEGRGLRVGAGVLCLTATVALLGVLWPAVFGAASGADVYLTLDATLSVLPGVGVACALGAASGLYVAEELPRAAHALGLQKGGSAARATQVTSMVLGATLFVLTMSVVSHFSSAAGLVSP